jgi:hypothetical protein
VSSVAEQLGSAHGRSEASGGGRRAGRLRVGLVAATGSWRPDLQAYLEHHVDGVEVLVLRDPQLVIDERLDLVIVDDASSVVGRDEVERLLERSIPLVGIYHRDGSGRGSSHLHALGIDTVYPADTAVVDLARMVRRADPLPDTPHASSAPAMAAAPEAATEQRRLDALCDQVFSPARIVTIGGVSERRHELAALIASGYGRHQQSMIIDLDPFRPRLARRFRLQLQPNLLNACRSAGDSQFDPLHFTARRAIASVELPFWSLVGLPSAHGVESVDGADLAEVVEAMSNTWPRLVLVADGVTGSTDARAMRVAGLRAATTVLVAVDPTPEGVLESLDWLVHTDAMLDERMTIRPVVDIAVCGRPNDGSRRLQIAEQLREHRPPGSIGRVVFIPWDDDQVTAASWEGRPISRRTRMARAGRRVAQLLSEGSTKRLEVL